MREINLATQYFDFEAKSVAPPFSKGRWDMGWDGLFVMPLSVSLSLSFLPVSLFFFLLRKKGDDETMCG